MKRDGAALISHERRRQVVVEGYTAESDAGYHGPDLALAAVCYATPASYRTMKSGYEWNVPHGWPWARRFWKPTPDDRVRELVKAGALIAAEIDRLLARR